MRCRVGDLAIMVRQVYPENISAIVEVIRPANLEGWDWIIKGKTRLKGINLLTKVESFASPGTEFLCQDTSLQPIRDQPGQDETLTWKPRNVEKPKVLDNETTS